MIRSVYKYKAVGSGIHYAIVEWVKGAEDLTTQRAHILETDVDALIDALAKFKMANP